MATRFKDVFSACRCDRIRGRLLKHCPDYKRHQPTRQGWTLRGDSEPRAKCPLLAAQRPACPHASPIALLMVAWGIVNGTKQEPSKGTTLQQRDSVAAVAISCDSFDGQTSSEGLCTNKPFKSPAVQGAPSATTRRSRPDPDNRVSLERILLTETGYRPLSPTAP